MKFPWGRGLARQSAAVIGLTVVLTAWTATSAPGGAGRARSMTLPAGNVPTAAATGVGSTSVLVSWTASSGGAPIAGYEIRSYDAGTGTSRTVGAGCSGVIAALTCIETSVPVGTWEYTVTPRQQAWRGAESAPSDPAHVDLTRPAPTNIALLDSDGSLEPGIDEVVLTFSEDLDPSTICSAWTTPGDQALGGSGVVVEIDPGVLVVNDVLTVTAPQCTLHIGTLTSGGDWVTLNSTYGGSTGATESRVSWNATSHTLTIHIGARITGFMGLLTVLPGSATYRPDAAMTDLGGQPIVTTAFTVNSLRF